MQIRNAGLLLALSCALMAQEPTAAEKLIDSISPAIVTIKAVQTISVSSAGGSQSEENKVECRGVVVDKSGIVMLSDGDLNGTAILRAVKGDPRFQLSISTNEILVLFEGDEKEYKATLVAKDSDLDLAFIKIDELGDKALSVVDFATGDAAAIGHKVYSVSRLGRDFDFAPHYMTAHVVGKIKKPRKLQLLRGDVDTGLPVFSAEGKVLGAAILLTVEGEDDSPGGRIGRMLGGGGDPGMQIMLLPAKNVEAMVAQAREQAQNLQKSGENPQ